MWVFSAIANAVGRNFIGSANYLYDLIFNRAKADGGVTEAQQCTIDQISYIDKVGLISQASLLVTPTSYNEGKLYADLPTNGNGDFTVTRATTATRVDSAGLVELVPYNLISWSEQFDNAVWSKSAGVVVTPNADIAPNGTLTADVIDFGAASRLISQAIPATTGVVLTGSFYIKGIAGQTITIAVAGVDQLFTLDGTWQRLGHTRTTSGTVLGLNLNTYASATARVVSLWGAQLVEGTNALPYQKTETRLNIPRLDYSLGGCPSILVEPQRTNLLTYSSSFDNAAWNREDISVTANASTSPSGNTDADKLVPNTNNIDHTIYEVVASGSSKTFSIYAKADGYNYVFIGANNYPSTDGVFFDLINGVVTTNTGGYTASITDEGDGWYRCSITSSNWPTIYAVICTSANGTSVVHTGNGTSGVLIWGAQMEVGAYATSYIPTTTASVTRNADVISKTGISSLIGQTEGTIYFDGVINGCENAFANILNSERNTNASFYLIYIQSSSQIRASLYSSGVEAAPVQGGSVPIGSRFKVAYAYKSGSSALYINGVQITTSSAAFTLPNTIDDLYIADQTTYFSFGESVRNNATTIFKTRLTNAELAQLTTI